MIRTVDAGTARPALPDLKPCPFCGGEELMLFCDPEEGRDNSGKSRRVQCAGCNVEAPFYSTAHEAIAAWNRRARPAPPQHQPFQDGLEALVERPASVQAAFEVFEGRPETGPHATAIFAYIVSIEARITALIAERDEALAEIERMTPNFVAYEYLEAPAGREIAEAELHAISVALDSPRFMDPPDGGSLTLAEQVTRMRVALETAERDLAAAEEVIRPFADVAGCDIGDSESDEDIFRPMDERNAVAPRITVGDLRAAARWLAGRAK